jgi:hypothetical protein
VFPSIISEIPEATKKSILGVSQRLESGNFGAISTSRSKFPQHPNPERIWTALEGRPTVG